MTASSEMWSKPWPIPEMLNRLSRGTILFDLTCRRNRSDHDRREQLLEQLLYDLLVEDVGPHRVALRESAETILGLDPRTFPGSTYPDLVLRTTDEIHVCEVKSNRVEYNRFDCILSAGFRHYLKQIGHIGPDPTEVEADIIKLVLYRTLSTNVGSCFFILVDAYKGRGRSWSRAFQDSTMFSQFMRTGLVRSWTTQILNRVRIIPLATHDAAAEVITFDTAGLQIDMAAQQAATFS